MGVTISANKSHPGSCLTGTTLTSYKKRTSTQRTCFLCKVIASKTQQPARRKRKTMSIYLVRLIVIWLLPLTGSSAVMSGLQHNSTNVMTGNMSQEFNEDHVTAQQVSSLSAISEVTQSIMIDVNTTEQTTTRPSTKGTLVKTNNKQTAATKTDSMSSQNNSSTVGIKSTTEAQLKFMKSATTEVTSPASIPTTTTGAPSILTTQTDSISSQNNSSTVGIKSTTEAQLKFMTSATTEVTSPASIPTTTTGAPSILTTSIQSQDTAKTLTSQFITHPTSPTQPINVISTTKSLVTADDTMQVTGFHKTSPVTSPFIPKQDLPKEIGTQHNKVVAGLIGGALVMMMVAFLLIYIKTRKLRRQQKTSRDWAGPSPFIEGGADDGPVKLRASNQISLSSFLPQRLSKNLSLLTGIDEQLKDMTSTTTFGDKYEETVSGRELNGNNVQKGKTTTTVVPEMKSMGDIPEMFENSTSLSSTQENDLQSSENKSEKRNLSEEQPATPASLPGAVETE